MNLPNKLSTARLPLSPGLRPGSLLHLNYDRSRYIPSIYAILLILEWTAVRPYPGLLILVVCVELTIPFAHLGWERDTDGFSAVGFVTRHVFVLMKYQWFMAHLGVARLNA